MSETQQDYRQMPLAEFVEAAAARTPTPGGGSIAAVAGALGTAMFAMSVNFTRGGKSDKFKHVEGEMNAAADEMARARSMFLELMSEDMKAFAAWQEASRLDKADPKRPEALKFATLAAVAVPREQAALCLTVLQRIAHLADKINERLLSDVGVAGVLVEAALRAAHYNIRVNLGSLDGEQDVAALRSEMAESTERARNLLAQIEAKLAGKF
ncbi:MAG: hypothetical protein BIFFINMI_01695 [Phycisphaerae bacterium]|nr:hypothetical protein [Phycisphaerae bacterium]